MSDEQDTKAQDAELERQAHEEEAEKRRAERQEEADRRAYRKSRQRNARDAANEIRNDLMQAPPDAHHFTRFAESVCRELGVDVTPINVARVIHSLQDKGIEPEFSEYPKWVGADEKGVGGMLVRNEEEERAYLDALDGDPEAAAHMRDMRTGEVYGGGAVTGLAANAINPVRDRPPYEPGALPGEPGGQDGPEASPVRLGTDDAKAPPQTIDPPHNDPNLKGGASSNTNQQA